MEEITAAVAALQSARDALIERIDQLNAQREAVDEAIAALELVPTVQVVTRPAPDVTANKARIKAATFPCEQCTATFTTQQGRTVHTARMHGKNWSTRTNGDAKKTPAPTSKPGELKITPEQAAALIDDSAA